MSSVSSLTVFSSNVIIFGWSPVRTGVPVGTTGFLHEPYIIGTQQGVTKGIRFGFRPRNLAPPPGTIITPIPGGGKREYDWHIYRQREEVKKRLPKKRRRLVDELDEMLVLLKERIVEVPEEIAAESRYLAELRRGQAIAEQSLIAEFAASEIRAQVARLRAIIGEIDDEEAILLALH